MQSLTEFLTLPSPITVCDIGAALSEKPAYQHLVDVGAARIIGFEPTQKDCDELNATYGKPHRFFPYFIADGKPHTFHETNFHLTGSLFEPNNELNGCFNNLAEVLQPVAQHPVSTRRLDDIEEIDDIDFIKIDVQGAELMVFQNAPRLLATTLVIQTEVEFLHHYKDQPLFADVDIELRRHDFQFHTFQYFGQRTFKPIVYNENPNAGLNQYIWSDAVYVRNWLNFERLSSEKMLKYAVLVHDIFGSYDLCHFVLAALGKREGTDIGNRYQAFIGATEDD